MKFQIGKSGNKKMNFLRKKKNQQTEPEPDEDYRIRFKSFLVEKLGVPQLELSFNITVI